MTNQDPEELTPEELALIEALGFDPLIWYVPRLFIPDSDELPPEEPESEGEE